MESGIYLDEAYRMLALGGGCLVIDGSSTASAAASQPGVLEHFFGWPPLFWTLRFALLILIFVAAWALLLYAARFFRPTHIWDLLTAPPPRFTEVGGKFAGAELSAKLAQTEKVSARELEAVNKRIDDAVEDFGRIAATLATAQRALEERIRNVRNEG